MAIVPDVSAILSLAPDDQDADYAAGVIETVAADDALVPRLFWYEIRNALLAGERRKRLSPERTTSFLSDLKLLPFVVDDAPRESTVLNMARRHSLTIYDAAYLELADRKGIALATLGAALMKAAKSAGVEVFSSTNKKSSKRGK